MKGLSESQLIQWMLQHLLEDCLRRSLADSATGFYGKRR